MWACSGCGWSSGRSIRMYRGLITYSMPMPRAGRERILRFFPGLTYRQGVGVAYALQNWIALGLDYAHTQRHSIASGQFNYEQHLTTLSAKLTF